MSRIDDFILKYKIPESPVVYTSLTDFGMGQPEEDYFTCYRDECFVLADGNAGLPNAAYAAKNAGDTALWGYQLIRQKKFYWQDKKMFIKRIFRTVNISLWQKRRETGFESGLSASLAFVINGTKSIWLGNVGSTRVYQVRGNSIILETKDDIDEKNKPTKVLGVSRFGLTPAVYASSFIRGDFLIMASDGVNSYILPTEIIEFVKGLGNSEPEIREAAAEIIKTAKNRGSRGCMTVVIIKKKS